MTRRIVLGVILFLAIGHHSFAQENPNLEQGLQPFSSFGAGNIDHVNLGTGNLYVQIPLLDYPQRGKKLSLRFRLQSNNKTWMLYSTCNNYGCTYYWGPTAGNGRPSLQVVDDQAWSGGLRRSGYRGSTVTTFIYAPDGSSHPAGVISGTISTFSSSSDASVELETGDGTAMKWSGPGGRVLIDRDGTRIKGWPVEREDANGNKITTTTIEKGTFQYAYYYVDSLGRSIPYPPNGGDQDFTNVYTSDFSGCTGPRPVTRALLWYVPGPNGGTATLKFCYVNIIRKTNFKYDDGNPYSTHVEYSESAPGAEFLQSVVLPNGTAWTFEYDSFGPGDPPDVNYGDLTKITFPTGGTISYSYVNAAFSTDVAVTPLSRAVAMRTTDANDGTAAHTWRYVWGSIDTTTTPPTMTNVVTDPNGNDTVYVNQYRNGMWRKIRREVYQGLRSPATLLQTVLTEWSYKYLSGGRVPSFSVSFPIRETTVWSTGKTSKVETDYDQSVVYTNGGTASYGNVVAERQYDYGDAAPGPLLRSSVSQFLAFENGNYKNNHIVSVLSSLTVYDGGGAQISRTTFGYDEYTLTPSGITTQLNLTPATGSFRGNLTSVRHWLNIAGAYLTSTKTYFNTGMVDQATDPGGHTTTFTYSPTFAGAYVTQTQFPNTNSPDPAQHIISGNYDFNTGLLTSLTDENGKTSTYNYDNMWRISTAVFPSQNGLNGQTNFYYPDPQTVERQQRMDGTRWTDLFVRFDGLGREIRRITGNDEATPWDQVDTCYDPRGYKGFVSYTKAAVFRLRGYVRAPGHPSPMTR